MKEDELNHRLRELIDIISGKKIKKPISKTDSKKQKTNKETRKSIEKITNSLQELRICIKYLLFDVEATRRERDKFKRILDNQSPTAE